MNALAYPLTCAGESTMLPPAVLGAFFEDHPLPCWVYDLATLRFLDVNCAATECYGYSRDEFLAMTLANIRPDDDLPALVANVASHCGESRDSKTWRHKRKDNSILFVRILSRAILFRDRSARLVVACDIQEQAMTEQALLRSNSLLHSV